MKIHNKIFTIVLMSGCLLSQHAAYATPVNAYVGASMGFQRGLGTFNGRTFLDGRNVPTASPDISYPSQIGQSDPVANLFFEVDTKVSNCFSIGLRPYYHLNSFEATVTRNGDLGAFDPGLTETVDFSIRSRHAYGLLLAPKMHFKEVTVYGLLGAEFSHFKTKINRTLSAPGDAPEFLNIAKSASSSAAVFGLGVSRELGNWSLFAEGQYKHYQTNQIKGDTNFTGEPASQFLKFSPKFASLMFGVKYKII
ncbi:MAG: hypothetical protein ACOH2E_04805 [Candidatus Paracaedibacter sp.]